MKELTLQTSKAAILKTVLGQHALDCAAQDFTTTPFGEHLVHRHALQATRSCRVGVVLLLESLLSCRLKIVASDNDNVVTAVCRWVVDGLVLAHEDQGNRRGQTAERAFVGTGIDIVPCARVGETGLRGGLLVGVAPEDSALKLFTLPTSCDMMAVRAMIQQVGGLEVDRMSN